MLSGPGCGGILCAGRAGAQEQARRHKPDYRGAPQAELFWPTLRQAPGDLFLLAGHFVAGACRRCALSTSALLPAFLRALST